MNTFRKADNGLYIIELGDGREYPFDFSMNTIYQFSEKAGWKKDTIDVILGRLTTSPTLGDHIDLFDLAVTRGLFKDKNYSGKPEKGDMLARYFIIFKALVDSIEVFFADNGIETKDTKVSEEKKGTPLTI
jgi:hypothetical protein